MTGINKYFMFFVLSVFLVSSAEVSKADEIGLGDDVIHVVVKGDTLWDISETYLEDPFMWPQVWKFAGNEYIRNPHLIYPGDKIRISPDGVMVVCPPGVSEEDCFRPPTPAEIIEPPRDVPAPVVEAPKKCDPKFEDCGDWKEPTVVKLVPKKRRELPVVRLKQKPRDEEPIWIESIEDTLRRKISTIYLSRTGFVSTKDRLKTGVVLAPKEKGKILIHDRDIVYLSFKNTEAVKEGSLYTIFEEKGIIHHPKNGAPVGYYIDIIGKARILYATDDIIEAKIEKSYQEINIGMELMLAKEMPDTMAITETDQSIEGQVIANRDRKVIMSGFDIVYIDKGKASGLTAGNLLRVFRPRPDAKDPIRGGRKTPLPDINLGEILVTEVYDEHSTAIVLKSVSDIIKGDLVSTDF